MRTFRDVSPRTPRPPRSPSVGGRTALLSLTAMMLAAARCSSGGTADNPAGDGASGAAGVGASGGAAPGEGAVGTAGTGGAGGAGDRGGNAGEAGNAGAAGASAGAATGGYGGAGATRPKRANIVFVLADDFSMNLLQFMPNVLRMQQGGATFSNYFVTDSLCCPSRTSILTGRFPHLSGVFTNIGPDGGFGIFNAKGNASKTYGVALQGAGYRTAFLGKYLNGYDPTGDAPPAGWATWDVAGNGYPEFDYDLRENGKVVSYGHTPADYLTDVVARLGDAFVRTPSEKPFAIEIATFAPHKPYTPAPRDADAFPGLKAPRTPAFAAPHEATDPKWLRDIAPLTAGDETAIDGKFRLRAQSVLAIDALIGKLQKAIVDTGHEQDTYIFFSSDNGYHLGEHSLRAGKMTAFDTDIHVPLVVVGPGVPAGLRVDAIAENVDLCGTFADLGGVKAPATSVGRSLVPWLMGGAVNDWRDAALVEHHGPDLDPSDPDMPEDDSGNPTSYEALRTLDQVYVEYSDGEKEFHDHKTDPDELHNTVASLTPAQASALHASLKAASTCTDAATCWAAQHLTK